MSNSETSKDEYILSKMICSGFRPDNKDAPSLILSSETFQIPSDEITIKIRSTDHAESSDRTQ
ncbi:MAG: hypothetical protein GY795_33855 [Desulfobacterales bacterium]|nr:hypothetical protein [Desulfobacterales bacterium]